MKFNDLVEKLDSVIWELDVSKERLHTREMQTCDLKSRLAILEDEKSKLITEILELVKGDV